MQEISTAYGRSLVKQHLSHFDLVFSAGPYCRTAFHVRRLFDQQQAFPFDWLVAPATSLLCMLRPDYRFSLSREQLFFTKSAQVALNIRDQILHLHDFERTSAGLLSADNLDEQLVQINSKYMFLFERLRQRLQQANRCLLIFEGLMPALELEAYRQRTASPELVYPDLSDDFARDLVAMLLDAYGVQATLVCFSFGAPLIERQGKLLRISVPFLSSEFDKQAEPYERPWASYDLFFALLCSAFAHGTPASAVA
jgi:hypothetical protein